MGNVRVGASVEFADAVDYSPHTTIEKGERGTVVALEDAFGEPAVEVRLEKFHFGLCEWMNTVLLVGATVNVLKDLTG